ncbi:hypothetical protein MTP03_15180 [Tsukamurella sp. PLM1]|nr:hypothetical protein MTP03_15180 [Tsukamurella sp. PLM1]
MKAKARVRLEMAADRMAKELLKIAVSDDAPDTVKLNAIKDALDRAGLSAKTAVEVEVGPSKAFEDVLGAVLSGGSRAASRAERGVPDAEDANRDWLDGEIVDAQATDLDDEAPAPRPRPARSRRPRRHATRG